jgi:hypothetical protein
MLVSCFCDESGKLQNTPTSAFAAVAGWENQFQEFEREWKRKLRGSGLDCLTMKEALNHRRPLSHRQPALGLENRITALMPFVECIRRHLEMVVGVGVDSDSFRSMPDNLRDSLPKDPNLLGFILVLFEVLQYVDADDSLHIVTDDEERLAVPMFKLYRAAKRSYVDVRRKLAGVAFADDEIFVPLQAADMVSSLIRREVDLHFRADQYDYKPLYDALCDPQGRDKLCAANVLLVGKRDFGGLAQEFSDLRRRYPDGNLLLQNLR